jgi:ATP-dependent exoDNAse (exonuclease V) beta subunit
MDPLLPATLRRAARLAARRSGGRVARGGRAVAAREERERVRLLYVGFTRARDHLILVARSGKDGPKTVWLDDLCSASGERLLDLPTDVAVDEVASVGVQGNDGQTVRVPARHWRLGQSPTTARLASTDPPCWFATPSPTEREPAPLWIAPSRAALEWEDLAVPGVGDAESTGSRLPLGSGKGVDWDTVGNTLHAFLAADVPELDAPERLDCARRLLSASQLEGLLAAESLLQAGDGLRRWVGRRWPAAIWHREVSIDSAVRTSRGERRIRGTIDLLLELPAGVVLIDHKSYPGGMATWREKAATFAPQIAAYAAALEAAGKSVVESWVSFAVAGGAVRILSGQLQAPA